MVALIGIDCATQPNKVGLALGELHGECVRIKACRTASPKERPEHIVDAWLQDSGRALLALDAPLGWPLALQQALGGHQAGEPMVHSAHALFRERQLAKQPNLPPLGPQGNACKSRLRSAIGRRDGVGINQGGARMDDTPPRYQAEAR